MKEAKKYAVQFIHFVKIMFSALFIVITHLLREYGYLLLCTSMLIFSAYIWQNQRNLEQIVTTYVSTTDGITTIRSPKKPQNSNPTYEWRGIQAKLKNAVVQIFSQVAAVDLLQPYKSPAQDSVVGTGFFINNEGEIVTNAHVIEQAVAITIQLPSLGKRQIDVEVIGASPERDLALLRVKPEYLPALKEALGGTLPVLELGDSDDVVRADEIMTLGYPLGQQGLKSTTGVVSGREQQLIQISAPINPGNSGGPSLDTNGRVIGINTSYIAGAQNVGYIIPVNDLKLILDELHSKKLHRPPFLGLMYQSATESFAACLGNPPPGGAYIIQLYKGSPLYKAGIQKGDMLYEIDGHEVDVYGEIAWGDEKISIIDYVSRLKSGQKVSLIFYRNGVKKAVSVILEQSELLPISRIYPGYEPIEYEIIAGMVVQPLKINLLPLLVNTSPSLMRYVDMKFQMEPMLVVTHIFVNSAMRRCRSVVPGSTIEEVNGVKVRTLDDLRTALFKSATTGYFTIEMTDSTFFVMPFQQLCEEANMLKTIYQFEFSPATRKLVAMAEQTDKRKSLVSSKKQSHQESYATPSA